MKNSKPNKMRAEATIAITIPAMAPPDTDLRVVYYESAELELDKTLPALIVVVANSIPAAVLDHSAVESEVKVEVEVDEGPCENESASTAASTRSRHFNAPPATTRTATYRAPHSMLNYLYQSQSTNDSHSEQRSSPESVYHLYHRHPISAYSLATYSLI